ncbi:hypothetical protein EJ05DRAFT_483451 [Pseudovirgaria hyperparasitica]|uniref:Zn(2)-C6 fungal-type domain-containing protein n=1 Tax=Pseudovirgaria hyperparasitica TaxID=470096 RepID=A0A6A6WE91_9PEZI|nr:uncharacterized protein EJ05DRAFT_483451 [Pseudovirgaria hyperparasitica]KAF2761033.1 hypothetical protein EJ05DRAFT_483451 [Pseudovirgaria hyperparasitica]
MFLKPPPAKLSAPAPAPHAQATSANDHHDEYSDPIRVKKACNRCRIRKVKCDGKYPCGRCRHDDVPCLLGRKDRGDVKELSRGYIRTLETQQTYLLDALKALSQRGPNDHGLKNIIARLEASGLDVSAIRNAQKEHQETPQRSKVEDRASPVQQQSSVSSLNHDNPVLSRVINLPSILEPAEPAAVQNGNTTANLLESSNHVNVDTEVDMVWADLSMSNDVTMPALDDPTFAEQWWENWINVSNAMDMAPQPTDLQNLQQE